MPVAKQEHALCLSLERGHPNMALYIDENGEELSGWQEGHVETLTELVNALGDYWNAGILTLAAAVKVYAQTACLTEDEAAEFLIGLWVDDRVSALEYGDN